MFQGGHELHEENADIVALADVEAWHIGILGILARKKIDAGSVKLRAFQEMIPASL
jgi:hypothetical protein